MANDGHAKFLYTMMKQLDTRNIDWSLVASELDITNGHAARMRFSRLRNQMEANSSKSSPEASTPKKQPTPKKIQREGAAKGKKRQALDMTEDEDDNLNGAAYRPVSKVKFNSADLNNHEPALTRQPTSPQQLVQAPAAPTQIQNKGSKPKSGAVQPSSRAEQLD